VPHPSGSEDIPRAHWLAGLVFWTLCPLSLGALVWLNLARVAASAWPGPRGDRMLGTLLMAITRPERVGQVWAILTNGRAALHGVLAGMLRHTPPDPLRVWWLEWWQFALTHMLGSPPVARGIAVNTAGAAMALVGAGVLSRLLTQTRAFDGRIGTSRWASPKDLRPFTRAARRPGALPLGRIARRRNGAGTGLALPLRDARRTSVGSRISR